MTDESENPAMDKVLEEFYADNGVRAEQVSRNAMGDERVNFVKVYGTRSHRYASLDTGEPRSAKQEVKLAEMKEGVSYEVLCGLAAMHGYKLVPK